MTDILSYEHGAVRENGSTARLAIDTIRTLAMDAVQKASSGHPGTPMALAPIAHTLWTRFLRYDPDTPDWPNRDRFVLSCGHASMLLYALLHLAGVKEIDADGKPTGQLAVSLDDIKQFRQLSSKTPGHPEYRMTTGVETTTGPLGQGCGNSVGMAIASRWLGSTFNRDGFSLFDNDVYVFCSDGDVMEGVASEAASLAGHLRVSNLCWVYDNNHITIEGGTELAFDEDVGKRFEAYGWNVIHVDDAEDIETFASAVETFKANADRPTLIVVQSVIGIGFPTRAGTHKAHSDAPGEEEIRGAKKSYGWPEDEVFLVPPEAKAEVSVAISGRGKPLREAWEAMFARYRNAYPDLAEALDELRGGKLPGGWEGALPTFDADAKGIASREASGKVINAIAPKAPWLVGGAADLSPSTKTDVKDAPSLEAVSPGGRNMHFGVREHAMGSIANGMALTYLRSYTGTFMVFSDYMRPPMRPPIRLAAIMELPVVFVFTHDSIGVGEDGPTHQPIEQLAALRAIPGLDTIRPGDANEVSVAWKVALTHTHEPTALIFSRQAIPTLDRSKYAPASGLEKGGYVLADCDGDPEIILIGTGSELPMVVAAHETLTAEGVKSRVVSLPSWYLYEKQDRANRESVLPPKVRTRLAVEQAGSMGWDRYVTSEGATITMSTFGASAPLAKLQEKFGFKREQFLGDRLNALEASLPAALQKAVDARLETARADSWTRRLWQGDASLCTDKDEGKWLGWLAAARGEQVNPDALTQLGQEAKQYKDAVLLGMGGSSLGPEVLSLILGSASGSPRPHVLDTTDPGQIAAVETQINPKETLFIVSSKSGSTMEPEVHRAYFFEKSGKQGDHFIAVIDPGSDLKGTAKADGFAHVYLGDPAIGGRYSALSVFGMVPAAAIGIDTHSLFGATAPMVFSCGADVPPADNPGLKLGAIIGEAAVAGRDKLTIVASKRLEPFGAWLEQLLAESTGKQGKGIVPVDLEPLGTLEKYGSDRLFVHFALDGDTDLAADAKLKMLAAEGAPVVTIRVAKPGLVGQEFVRWEIATAVAGAVIGIDPFDQPDVEEAKVATRKLVDAYEESGALEPDAPAAETADFAILAAKGQTLSGNAAALLKQHFASLKAGDYAGFLAYIERDDANAEAIGAMRTAVRNARLVATVAGFGPRLLHSTGQAYKGGPIGGAFLTITREADPDLAVPGRKASFGTVQIAQARGDTDVLTARGQRVLRVHLKKGGGGIAALKAAVLAALSTHPSLKG